MACAQVVRLHDTIVAQWTQSRSGRACMGGSAQSLDQERVGVFHIDNSRCWRTLCALTGRMVCMFTAIAEHGNHGAWNGTSATTALVTVVVCSNDADVLDGQLEALDAHEIVFGRLTGSSDAWDGSRRG
ncbi:hypothetical protein EDB83DRAFT_447257 [Lactarius deliciosus]|nr:hypothetical protein EDB83DRAFT_447257 [Lactarius deliciosus]